MDTTTDTVSADTPSRWPFTPERPLRLAIASCSRGLWHAETVESLVDELSALSKRHGASFDYRHVQVIGRPAPECWQELVAKLDNAAFPWNYVLFLEDDVKLPQHGIAMLVDEIEKAREAEPKVMAATYETYVHRYNRGGRIGALRMRPDKPFFVYTTGWYCLLVDRRAYELVDHDYKSIQGQDIQFCKSVNRAGLRIVAVPGVEIPHYYVKSFRFKQFTNDKWTGAHERAAY